MANACPSKRSLQNELKQASPELTRGDSWWRCSGDAELGRLAWPSLGKPGLAYHMLGGELRRLTAAEDRADDIGGEEAEPEDPGEVGRADTGIARQLGDGFPLVMHHHGVEPMRPGKQAQQASVRPPARPAARALDQEPGLHAGALQPGRDGKDEGRRILIVWMRLLRAEIGVDNGRDGVWPDGNVDRVTPEVDPVDEALKQEPPARWFDLAPPAGQFGSAPFPTLRPEKRSRPAARAACSRSRNNRRNRRESTWTGRKKRGRQETQRPSAASPPPGTRQWI